MLRIDVVGIVGARATRARVMRELTKLMARLRLAPTAARAAFFDDNGPKGGVAVRCALTARVPRVPPVRVEHTADAARAAFDGALAKLERRLLEHRRRRRDARRRPKKYFVARLAY